MNNKIIKNKIIEEILKVGRPNVGRRRGHLGQKRKSGKYLDENPKIGNSKRGNIGKLKREKKREKLKKDVPLLSGGMYVDQPHIVAIYR